MNIDKYFKDNRERILDEWFTLLRLPTLGADPLRLNDCARAAAWLKKYLKAMGFEVNIQTPDNGLPVPILFAERRTSGSGTTVLFYGHYDVQPADPPDHWETPPFNPVIRGNRVYARGAQDNKGQAFAFLQGIKALIDSGEKCPDIKIVMEGQEESGSAGLLELAPKVSDRLKADILAVCDTLCASDGRPAIIAGLRGIQNLTVTLKGPAYDLHSGVHGGVAPNPAQGIAELVATLHNRDGSIAVEGFCDSIISPSASEIDLACASQQSPEDYFKEVGCQPLGGERSLEPAVRIGFRPSIEVNGIYSGHSGPGPKTVIPSEATAKLSMRLVSGQKIENTLSRLKAHLEKHCPPGMQIAFSEIVEGAPGFRLSVNTPVFSIAEDVLKAMDKRGPVIKWEGASIPVVGALQKYSGATSLLVGFGREEDKIHCPNESFGLDQFQQVMNWSYNLLQALSF
ncbi:MAG: M20/M25/M40 family metallo-hydrolase [Kiritimatiellia bacterium]